IRIADGRPQFIWRLRYAKQHLRAFSTFLEQLSEQLQLTHLDTGMLPGDRSFTIDRGPVRVGVLSLNTTHTGQRVNGVVGIVPRGERGRFGPEQLAAACGGDVGAWARRCDAVVVVSQHGGLRLYDSASQLLARIEAPLISLCGESGGGPTVTPNGELNHLV